MTTVIRNDRKAARQRPHRGFPDTHIPTVPLPANQKMEPAARSLLLSLVVVKAHMATQGHYRRKVWVAKCRAARCKFSATYESHNGAQQAAARHRREKAYTKLHGAQERSMS